jgi:hypothetical protein
MAITTYTELRAAVQRWLDNDNPNLIAAIPDFIALAESSFNRVLRCRERECRITTPLVPTPEPADPMDRGVYDLPEDWGGHRSVKMIRGAEALAILYWQRIPPLSEETPSNWLLTKHPDIYLYGSLSMGEAFLKDDPRLPLWGAALERAVEDLRKADWTEKISGSRARVRMRGQTPAGGKDNYVYLPPDQFFAHEELAGMPSFRQAGYYTVTENFLRIWPRP